VEAVDLGTDPADGSRTAIGDPGPNPGVVKIGIPRGEELTSLQDQGRDPGWIIGIKAPWEPKKLVKGASSLHCGDSHRLGRGRLMGDRMLVM
jgi:hypothetical protein